MTQLSDYLRERVRIDGLSNRAFARRCDISPATADRLLKGRHKPDVETLEKVARGLPAPLEKLLSLAEIQERTPFVLPTEAHLLEPSEWRTVVRVIRTILRADGRIGGEEEEERSQPVS